MRKLGKRIQEEKIRKYLLVNFCRNNPYRPLSENEILAELAESRACYARGEGEDFDEAIDEIGTKYGLYSYYYAACETQAGYVCGLKRGKCFHQKWRYFPFGMKARKCAWRGERPSELLSENYLVKLISTVVNRVEKLFRFDKPILEVCINFVSCKQLHKLPWQCYAIEGEIALI